MLEDREEQQLPFADFSNVLQTWSEEVRQVSAHVATMSVAPAPRMAGEGSLRKDEF
jgi:hypothetical protein